MTQKRIRWRLAVTLVVIFGVPLFLYQNCAKSGFSANSSDSIIGSSAVSNSLTAGAPFAYEAQADTISYNSCFGGSLAAHPEYFTLRVTGNDGGGVRLNENFLSYAAQKLKPSYPSTVVTSDQIKTLLATSPNNMDAQPQLSVRQLGTFSSYTRSGSSPQPNTDYISMLGSLTDDRWATDLATAAMPQFRAPASITPFTSYFPLGSSSGKSLIGTIAWNGQGSATWQDAEAYAAYVRSNYFNNDAILAITFPSSGNALYPRGLQTGGSTAYGTGYRLQFSTEQTPYSIITNGGSYAPYTFLPNNIMSSVQEVDLATGQPSANGWTCNSDFRLTIVRLADRATYCPVESFAAVSNPTYKAELAIIRRHYPADKWDVNVTRHCLVPKDMDCYVPDGTQAGQPVGVEYNESQPCFQSIIPSYPGGTPQKLCAQHVSICVRN